MEKSVDSADLKSAAETHDGSSPSSGTKNPNNCSTCLHKKDPDGGWCYMFRNEPDTICNLHTVSFYMAEINSIDLKTAELVITAFRLKHPELTEYQKAFLAKIEKNPQIVFFPRTHGRNTMIKELKYLENYRSGIELAERPKRDKVRKSTKTGATWPKPKGSY
jgi:hypothetical protein